ncbi:unnamed protein product [Prorocentrum cordatum]|uniref:Uncharacterized protein n=1 Tax=Prorocentrum cordatum TaxID=2364126 RepID=A0ABN9UN52_9DINO|nr:unnamed protein product [Polarella glacialis]
MRANSSGQSHIIRKCARAYDQIAQFTDEQHEHIIDQSRFHEHIRIIQERILVLELREHEQSPEYQYDDERTVKLHKLLKAWSPKHRRISLVGILDNQGHVISAGTMSSCRDPTAVIQARVRKAREMEAQIGRGAGAAEGGGKVALDLGKAIVKWSL